MKLSTTLFAILVLSGRFPAVAANSVPVGTANVENVRVLDVAQDRIRFEVQPRIIPASKVNVRSVSFRNMRINGVPVYLPPFTGKFEVRPGIPVSVLNAIPVTVYYRDLDSTVPIQKMIEERALEITGTAVVRVELGFWQRLAMGSGSARVGLPIETRIPVAIPGGDMGATGALAVLKTVDAAMKLGSGLISQLRLDQSAWTDRLHAETIPSLLFVKSTFRVEIKGQPLDLETTGVGFRISDSRFFVPGEMLAPWNYDDEVAALLKNHSARLIKGSPDVRVWPASEPIRSDNGYSLKSQQIRVVRAGSEKEKSTYIGDGQLTRFELYRRDSARNMAILEFTALPPSGASLRVASEDEQNKGTWDRVAVFRFAENASGQAKPEMLFLACRRDGDRIVLTDKVDSSAFGSPLVSPNGAVGILQDEGSGLLVGPVLRAR